MNFVKVITRKEKNQHETIYRKTKTRFTRKSQ